MHPKIRPVLAMGVNLRVNHGPDNVTHEQVTRKALHACSTIWISRVRISFGLMVSTSFCCRLPSIMSTMPRERPAFNFASPKTPRKPSNSAKRIRVSRSAVLRGHGKIAPYQKSWNSDLSSPSSESPGRVIRSLYIFEIASMASFPPKRN